jgi:endonuclease-3
MTQKQKIEFFIETLEKMFPNARCELDFRTPFQLLVAVILSAQTTDKQVNKVNKKFFELLKNPEDVAKI